jgi:hypothetical protein
MYLGETGRLGGRREAKGLVKQNLIALFPNETGLICQYLLPMKKSFIVFALATGLTLAAQPGQAQPLQTAPSTTATVAVRSAQLSSYLAESLGLSGRQRRAVARSTRHYLALLAELGETAERPGLVATAAPAGRLLPSPAALRLEREYEQNLARIFTPGQYNGYCWLMGQFAAAGR